MSSSDELGAAVLRFRADAEAEEPALLALRLLAVHRLREALEVTELALHREPSDEDVLVVHARILCELRDHTAARHALTEAVRLAPDWREAWVLLARVWMALRMEGAFAHDLPDPTRRSALRRRSRCPAYHPPSPAELHPGSGFTTAPSEPLRGQGAKRTL